MSRPRFLAFDLGAESGRAILGELDGRRLTVRELRRFPNSPITHLGHLHWNVSGLWDEVKAAMRLLSAAGEDPPESIAVDTWGVDFGLIGREGTLAGSPFAYRDLRNVEAMNRFLAIVPKERIYDITGIQFLPFNSLFQLYALTQENPDVLEAATDLLFMPDLFTFFLTGRRTNEATIASTSQLLDPRTRTWSRDLIAALGIRESLFHGLQSPGRVVGPLLAGVAAETGFPGIPVIATASHDTAAAVAAVPALEDGWAYISSGTWSLIGIETAEPLITPQTLALNFTNEGGMDGTVRFLKNVTGLWLVQQCRKAWSRGGAIGYDELTAMAESAPAFLDFVDPDAPEFLNPADMPEAIRSYCRTTGQPIPETRAAVIRCALESLALKYRLVLDELRHVARRPLARIHVIGGGTKNSLLCQFTADAAGIPVVAGPVEATAVGNILGQARALGYVRSLGDMREIVAASSELRTYMPGESRAWNAAYDRFRSILGSSRPRGSSRIPRGKGK